MRIIKVENCLTCPYCSDFKRKCMESELSIDPVYLKSFPPYCPLDVYEDEQVEALI